MANHLPSNRWKNLGMKLLLLAVSSLFCLAILECVFLVRAGYERNDGGPQREGGVFAPLGLKIEPDLISGYRFSPGKYRFARFHEGELLFDHGFVTNAQGYVCNHDFTRTKAAGKKRIAVLGDSFTAQWQVDVPWPEQLERRLNLGSTANYEFYNFAVYGSGLQNWHSIFFKELVPNYEFDAVVFAVWGNDLARKFYMVCSKDAVYHRGFAEPPRSLDEFHASYFPKMFRWAEIVSDEELTQMIAERSRWEWPGLKIRTCAGIASIVKGIKSKLETQPDYGLDVFTDHGPVTRADLELYYAKFFEYANEGIDGKAAIAKLYHMMDYCKAKNVPVVLCNIPTREGAMEFSRRRKQGSNLIQRQVQSVARDYGCLYFDGYQVFGDLSPEAIRDEYWLKYDGHWDKRGSDLFAEKLAEFLERHWQKDGVQEVLH